jgi:tetratricopeptide (TPR) repeat protein
MNPPAFDTQRRMVPRWRTLATTLQARELGCPINADKSKLGDHVTPPDLLTRLERWRLAPDLVTAAELVEACIVEGREREAVDAARRLVTIDRNAAPLIREQAAKLLERTGHGGELTEGDKPSQTSQISPRFFLKLHPHDPLAWVELALAQTIRGSSPAAARSMLVALSLAPDNRHVLRSAARMFLHQGDPERALATITRSSATRTDPWLVSSEISIASVANKPSRLMKAGTLMLAQGGAHPRQITELAGAIATEEMISGNRKKSRRSFAQSMLDPTGSSLAQGEWAAPQLGSELITETRLKMSFENAEALAFHAFRLRRFDEVRDACERWHDNDPFSLRPFEFGSAAASLSEDFETALEFARLGLEKSPLSPTLLNAFVFASASLDRIDDAAEKVAKIRLADGDKVARHITAANRGLIAFRRGDEVSGRSHYAEAIDGFRRDGLLEFSARAKIYLAREAMRNSASDWPALLKDAQDSMKKFKDSEGTVALRLIERRAMDKTVAAPDRAISSPPVPETSKKLTLTVKFDLSGQNTKALALTQSKENI